MSDSFNEIQGTFAQVDIWRLRAQHGCKPEPGSELHADDQVDKLGTYPPSQLVFGALASARDHLGAFHTHVKCRDIHPFADATLLRSSVASASNAIWILTPSSRTERVKNARCFAAETLKHHARCAQTRAAHAELSDKDRADNATTLANVEARRQRLSTIRAAAGESERFYQTRVIEDAVATSLGSQYVSEAKAEWQFGSGAAHGLMFPLLGRPGTQQSEPADKNGVAEFQAGGDLDSVSNIHRLAYRLLLNGWTLLDQRLQVK